METKMVFSSNVFLFAFLPALLVAYYLAPRKIKNLILLIFSLFFYAWGEPIYLILMIFSIVFHYVMGLDLEEKRRKGRGKRGSMVFAVLIDLFLLGFFKYSGFLVENIGYLFHQDWTGPNLPLPIGLSFYTFQAISYLADIASGKVRAQRNILAFGLYISMFPQLVAGPIVQYSDINDQLIERESTWQDFGEGTFYFIWGLAKKVLLANGMGKIFSTVLSFSELSVLTSWIGAFAYTFQIYFDFSGYSDMAIGLGKMFGFQMPENFDHPYLAGCITEFWRRWHISLGKWFREYVYIPLGGNRVGVLGHIRNILIVWFLTGLWHGASWNFVAWGLYYGILLIFEKYVLEPILIRTPFILRNLYTMLFVIIGWVLFFSDSLKSAMGYLSTMFSIGEVKLYDRMGLYLLSTECLSFLICAVCSTSFFKRKVEGCMSYGKDGSIYMMCLVHIMLFLLCVAYLISETYNPFLYFRF